jgi:hypothetical protein
MGVTTNAENYLEMCHVRSMISQTRQFKQLCCVMFTSQLVYGYSRVRAIVRVRLVICPHCCHITRSRMLAVPFSPAQSSNHKSFDLYPVHPDKERYGGFIPDCLFERRATPTNNRMPSTLGVEFLAPFFKVFCPQKSVAKCKKYCTRVRQIQIYSTSLLHCYYRIVSAIVES